MRREGLHRREFLQSIGAAALSVLGVAAAASTRLGCSDGGDPLLAAVAALFDEPERAARVGAAWQAQSPAPEARGTLLAELFGDDLAAARELAAADPAALREELQARHRADFDAGRTASVDGYVLSLTEVRLCALVNAD